MNVLDEISKRKNGDLIINPEGYDKWSDFTKTIRALKKLGSLYFYVLEEEPKTFYGMKCYVTHCNKIKCWMKVVSVDREGDKFILKLEPKLNKPITKYLMPNFKGFRYFLNGFSEQ
jgi:hypothetical protein